MLVLPQIPNVFLKKYMTGTKKRNPQRSQLLGIINISVQTVEIVEGLPGLKFE